MNSKVILFEEEKECCGCGACSNICSKNAIAMKENSQGFLFPQVDYSLCIGCGVCKKVCQFSNEERYENKVKSAWVAAAFDKDIVRNSASGGLFALSAKYILEQGGVVFGCSMEIVNGNLRPMHIAIDDEKDLIKLQGSKYVQSFIDDSYSKVKTYLNEGKKVLFSGTPCQVSGLYGFLGKKYDNLFTIDIICHGVPSASFFQGYITELEKKLNGKITDFKFRDKTNGWGLEGKAIYFDMVGNVKNMMVQVGLSSYYKLFLDSSVYRESCYNCVYANGERCSDITIGDYWKIGQQHPEVLTENGGNIDEQSGVSCILVNTEDGEAFLKKIAKGLNMHESSFEKVAKINDQLNRPSLKNNQHDEIMNLYETSGYTAVEQWYNKKLGVKKYFYYIWYKLPKKIRSILRKH